MAEYSDAEAFICFDVDRNSSTEGFSQSKRKLRDTFDYVPSKQRYDNNLSVLQFMSRLSPDIIILTTRRMTMQRKFKFS